MDHMQEESDNQMDTVSTESNRLYSQKDLAEIVGVPYERLRQFFRVSGVVRLLGGRRQPGVKGPRFPPEAVPVLKALVAAYQEGLVTPRTAEAWLQRLDSLPGDSDYSTRSSDGALQGLNGATGHLPAVLLKEALDRQSVAIEENNRLLSRLVELTEQQTAVLTSASEAPDSPPGWQFWRRKKG